MKKSNKTTAIILAGGSGKRFGDDKAYLKLAGKPVIIYPLEVYNKCNFIDDIIVVTTKENVTNVWTLAKKHKIRKIKKVVIGGSTRQESSWIGISSCAKDTKYVHIHDSVRPFIDKKLIKEVQSKLIKYKAIDVAIPAVDTIIKINDSQIIVDIPNRKYLMNGQTPQAFEYNLIKKAHELAIKKGIHNSTDDCSLVLRLLNHNIYVINGYYENIKITYPIDLYIAEEIFRIKTSKIFKRMNLKKLLKGKVVVVFGGSSGIGKSVVELVKDYGGKSYAISRTTAPFKADITKMVQLKKVLKKIYKKEKKIDFVVNSAGIMKRQFIENMSVKDFKEVYDVNIFGAFNITKAVIPYLKQTSGSLVHVGSSSYSRGRSTYSAYSSSKVALVNFVQAAAEELSGYNIKINVVSPERTHTPMRSKHFGKEDINTLLDPKEVADKILKVLTSDLTGMVFSVKKEKIK